MKIKTSMTSIIKNYRHVFYCGYCDLQFIMRGDEPIYYNSGVYGWNCDVYIDFKRDIAITTGYRNTRGKSIPHDVIKKYSDIAKSIISEQWTKPHDDIATALEHNRQAFFDELLTL